METLRRIFLLPASAVMVILFLLPMMIVFGYSVLTRGAYWGVTLPWSAESYRQVLDTLYLRIVWRSVWVASAATLICLVLAFPMAVFIARSKRKTALLNLVMLPFWTSFLVRIYAWMFILRDTGLINTVLQRLGLIRQPLPLLFNSGAVLLGLVYGYLPFMILPLYATLAGLDPALIEAAADLGAGPITAARRIVLPLAKPGIAAGCLLVFIPCLGAYLTPDLMGGGRTVMVGNLIQNQFTASRNWPFGAALSLILMLVVLAAGRLLPKRAGQLL
ncbi:MAG: ABC transporter permease [Acidobacteriaceae bacterium]|nr:ABC transporter permease [Acidobacteriaceae bacterium]